MPSSDRPAQNGIGEVGLFLSAIGFCHELALGSLRLSFVRYMTLCCLLGLVVSSGRPVPKTPEGRDVVGVAKNGRVNLSANYCFAVIYSTLIPVRRRQSLEKGPWAVECSRLRNLPRL